MGRRIEVVHIAFFSSAAIQIQDFERKSSRLEQDLEKSGQCNVLYLAGSSLDMSPAVLLQVLTQEEWLKVLRMSLDPSTGQQLRRLMLVRVAHGHHVNTCLEVGDDAHRRHHVIERLEQRGVISGRRVG